MLLNNKVYTIVKWVTQYLLPGSGTLYFTLAQIWGLSYGEQVIGTIAALNIFLGVLLGISSASYREKGMDGQFLIDTSGEKDIYRLDLGTHLEDLAQQQTVTLVVKPGQNLSSQG